MPKIQTGALYYGKNIGDDDLSYLVQKYDRGFSPNPNEVGNDRTYSLDVLPQEYTGADNGDYRICCLEVCNKNGNRQVDLKYKSHKIYNGKYSLDGLPALFDYKGDAQTLEILMQDDVTGLEVRLLYGVFEKQDVITRSVIVKNHNKEKNNDEEKEEYENKRDKDKNKKKSNKKKIIIISVLSVILIILIAVTVFLLLNKNNKKDEPKRSEYYKTIEKELDNKTLGDKFDKALAKNDIDAGSVKVISIDIDSDNKQDLVAYAEDSNKKYILNFDVSSSVTYEDSYQVT